MYAVIRKMFGAEKAITKAMNVLSKQFPYSNQKSLLYVIQIICMLWVKENINYKTKFDVLETEKTKKGF